MPGKDAKNGTRQKREDCKSLSTDGSSPEAKRLNEDQGSISDLHKDMKQVPSNSRSRTCSYMGDTRKDQTKHQLSTKRAKIPAVQLRGAS